MMIIRIMIRIRINNILDDVKKIKYNLKYITKKTYDIYISNIIMIMIEKSVNPKTSNSTSIGQISILVLFKP